jgi:hypothetical protein
VRFGESQRHLTGRASRPDGSEGTPGHNEVSGPMVETNDGVGTDGDVNQLGISDELQVAARIGRDGAASLFDELEQFVDGLSFSK